jgi:hypothetical protein
MQSTIAPTSLTILPTYKCNAACKDCCFQSSPRLSERISGPVILQRIREATNSFPSIKQVIFSGGEALLLKEDLHEALVLSTSLGLTTRLVSNGFWGKRQSTAEVFAESLMGSGLVELNISTGLDHQQFVPKESVVQAAYAATSVGIRTLITVEVDSAESRCLEALISDERVTTMLANDSLQVISNSWMPYESNERARHEANSTAQLWKGCSQIFNNVTIKPDDRLSACCGLTLERIPEMDLGANSGKNMRELYEAQLDDLMKIWIYLDGPHQIIATSSPALAESKLDGVVHICQACTLLHRDIDVASNARQAAKRMMPDIISRFTLRNQAEKHIKQGVSNVKS